MTSTDAVVVRFCKRTGVHSKLARRAIVHSLVDEALRRWFPRTYACYGVVDVVGADVVTMAVPEPAQLSCTPRDARGMPLLLASLSLFDPRRLAGGPWAPCQCPTSVRTASPKRRVSV
jgi:hypothetical protein